MSGWSGNEKGHLRGAGMLGSGETEAAGLRVSSLFPQMAIIHYLDFSCYFLHPPLFFPFCLCFYFKQLGWRQRMRVRGGWAPTRGGSRSPSSKGWAPSRRLTSPGAPRSLETDRALLPCWPHLPGNRRESLGWTGKRRDQQPGTGCARCRGLGWRCMSYPYGLARHLLEPASPSIRRGGATLLLGPPTLHDHSHPCLALRESRSSPHLYPHAIFIQYLHQDA